ncbi:hypothetical protein BDB00DRAFT_815017 [Zychaea mexicana]|uniref:uncharacterized protein n=1 Tax=Zychaea mexicana TaxID=64656 RepID=UPI0022FDCB29|nr:uncharacterized protein BDB00DRAFT_815017 [Zychaea mexicana]KAI9495178.1 hypothetical protein BDB00DRAFT_815017 [Zychaea mexicana]
MPVPIEYNNSVRRMSTITVPNQDISFDTYDFQLCAPQKDVKDAFESRELEAAYCRDFSCCGLVLSDLHDLLQHYEECHVRLEEEDEDDASFWSPTPPSLSSSSSPSASPSPCTAPSSPTLDDAESCDALKKKAAAYLSDLYNSATLSPLSLTSPIKEEDGLELATTTTTTGPLTPTDSVVEEPLSYYSCNESSSSQSSSSSSSSSLPKKLTINTDITTASPSSPSSSSLNTLTAGKKRSYQQFSSLPSALDLLTQSAAKKLALATGELPTPMLTDEDFLAQAGALLASANTNANADKPYKCNVPGCQKAYKNPNGLKYHNQHGHCDLVSDESENIASKPYQCTIGDCGKRYKNLNGLKYHIEHSHMAALNHTLASFGSSLFSPAFAAQFASVLTSASNTNNTTTTTTTTTTTPANATTTPPPSTSCTPDVSPQASPVMSAATLASFF